MSPCLYYRFLPILPHWYHRRIVVSHLFTPKRHYRQAVVCDHDAIRNVFHQFNKTPSACYHHVELGI
jgi:hypothetical protein